VIDGFTDAQVIGGLLALLVGSYAAFFGWLVLSLYRLDRKIDQRIGELETKLTSRMDRLGDGLTVSPTRSRRYGR